MQACLCVHPWMVIFHGRGERREGGCSGSMVVVGYMCVVMVFTCLCNNF